MVGDDEDANLGLDIVSTRAKVDEIHTYDVQENYQVREPSVETLSSLGGQQDEQFVDVQHPQSVLSRVQVQPSP